MHRWVAVSPNIAGHLSVAIGDEVIDAVRCSCVSAGGTVFTPIGDEVVVPASAIVAYDLDVTRLVVLRESRNYVPKWQLSSDCHSALLKLLSATLERRVADAIENVSGRT